MEDKKKKYYQRFIKFGLVGASGILVNSGVLYVVHDILKIPLAIASVAAVTLAIFNNFVLNDAWTWNENKEIRKHNYLHRLWRYYLSASFAAAINYIVLLTFTHMLGMYYLIANLIGILIGTVSNFVLGEYWVFKSRDD